MTFMVPTLFLDRTTIRRPDAVERFIGWPKYRRRLATRLEKLAENIPAMVKLVMLERLLKRQLPDTAQRPPGSLAARRPQPTSTNLIAGREYTPSDHSK
jgi:hypothetical protein